MLGPDAGIDDADGLGRVSYGDGSSEIGSTIVRIDG
jgi:hypothetical protein